MLIFRFQKWEKYISCSSNGFDKLPRERDFLLWKPFLSFLSLFPDYWWTYLIKGFASPFLPCMSTNVLDRRHNHKRPTLWKQI